MIKDYYNFINENKSKSKKKNNFLYSKEYKDFLNDAINEIKLDLEDSLVDILDMDFDYSIYYYVSDPKGKSDVNGSKLAYRIDISLPFGKKDKSLDSFESFLKKVNNSIIIAKDTISRFSENIGSRVSLKQGDIIISLKFITELDLKEYESIYYTWFLSNKKIRSSFYKDKINQDIIEKLIDYLDGEIYNIGVPFDYDIEYELKFDDRLEEEYVLFYLTDGRYRLGEDIATFFLEDGLDSNIDLSEMDISYEYIDEIVEEYLENLDQ